MRVSAETALIQAAESGNLKLVKLLVRVTARARSLSLSVFVSRFSSCVSLCPCDLVHILEVLACVVALVCRVRQLHNPPSSP